MAVGWLFVFVVLLVVLLPTLGTIYKRYIGLSVIKSCLLVFICIVLALVILLLHEPLLSRGDWHKSFIAKHFSPQEVGSIKVYVGILIASRCLLPFLLLPFVVNLYRKWIGNHVTEEERIPGIDGVRAWLSVGNLICAVGISICMWWGFAPDQLSALFWMLFLTLGSLLLYPLINTLARFEELRMRPREDLSAAREKILQLLEQGKITPEESAELLSALREDSNKPNAASPSTPPPSPSGE